MSADVTDDAEPEVLQKLSPAEIGRCAPKWKTRGTSPRTPSSQNIAPSPEVATNPSREQTALSRLEKLIIGSGQTALDKDKTSLQWRILQTLYRHHQGGRSAAQDLKTARASARKVIHDEFSNSALGGGGTEKNLKQFRAEYSKSDQIICNQIANFGRLTHPFHLDDFIGILKRAQSENKLPGVFKFIHALQDASEGRKGRLKYNVAATSMALFWTSPEQPLWLFPARNIAAWVNAFAHPRNAASVTSINSTIKDHGLIRLPTDYFNRLYSQTAPDKIRRLHMEIGKITRQEVCDSFRGAKKKQCS